ncbi:DUF3667 domain-containing protein [Aequorivita sp. H23M31]|uniref:DUF3667 domain-containing protein n=1 Tax=Aequorivita ciconiae TaxID=2494375 RepID=A0A410G6M5_9FLAO|nr:DUF3667 domain-containing protein [Aequorivita sp. H23M31]QAA82871.1 DUF3667 domain-containing protein [Aequorivita sp. H23M31]
MKCRKLGLSSRKSLQYRGTQCLNCGHPLDKSDVFCPYCSQLNTTKHLTAKDFFSEFLSSILVYDSRLRTTLKDLLFRPGVMSKNFINGQRLKYANPFRFFLSVSIIFFLMNGFLKSVTNSDSRNFLNINIPASKTPLDSLLVIIPKQDLYFSKPDSLTANALGIPIYFSEQILDSLSTMDSYVKRGSMYMLYYQKHNTEEPQVALEKLHHPSTFLNKWFYLRSISWNKILDNPNGYISYVISKIPFFIFFFTPFYAIFFWLLYSRKKHTYMEHMIFVFHIFSFVFLAMLLFLIPNYYLDNFFTKLLFYLIGPLYFYLALKKFYNQSYLLTFIKFVFLSIIFNIGFILAIMLFVLGSAAIY